MPNTVPEKGEVEKLVERLQKLAGDNDSVFVDGKTLEETASEAADALTALAERLAEAERVIRDMKV